MRRLLPLVLLALLALAPAARAADPVADLLGTASSAKARTALGLPPYKKLLGKGWKQKAAKADAAFVRELAAPRTMRQAPDLLGDDPLKAGDVLKGKGGKQTREMRMKAAITTGECPAYKTTDLPYMPFWFAVQGEARGEYIVTTTERVRNFDVTTTVVFEVRFAARGASGPDGISGPTADGGTVSVTRTQTARDRRTGKTRSTGPTQRYTSGLSPLFILEGGFDEFIAANEDGRPAPRRELRADVWEDSAQRFVAVLYLALEKDWDAVEKRMLTPNACVQLTFDGPERLAPGQAVDITGHLALTRSTAPEEALLKDARIRSGWLAPDVGQKLRWLVTGDNDIGFGKPWFELTAPAQAWPEDKPMGADVQIATSGGVAESGIRFKPTDPTLHYRILAATMDTRTTATGQDTYCGTQAGSRSYAGELASTEAFDPADRIELDGTISGEVDAQLTTRTTAHQLQGCGERKQACSVTMPDRQGTGNMSFSVSPASDPSEVTLRWTLHQPSVGFVDAGDPECNVHIWAPFGQEVAKRTVPLAALQSTDPITMRFEGQGDLDKNHDGMLPAQIHHSWSYVFKLQRVGPDGSPL